MNYTYVDPSLNEKDRYRFLVDDVGPEDEFILSDEEIQFVIDTYENEQEILMHLFERLMISFSKMATKKKLGPQTEEYTDRLEFFKNHFTLYKEKVYATSVPIMEMPHKSIFDIGMNDNKK